jgi:hypothetical protein
MAGNRSGYVTAATGAALLLGLAWVGGAAPPGSPPDGASGAAVTRAREQAKLMHGIYASTLDVMHHYYFRTDRAVLPARALEDVFADMQSRAKVKARWIAVNAKAMSVDHQPASAFEKDAARAIAAGKSEYERVADGYYHRAGAIPLGSGCVNCHTGFFAKDQKAPRFAGLVISVPLAKE